MIQEPRVDSATAHFVEAVISVKPILDAIVGTPRLHLSDLEKYGNPEMIQQSLIKVLHLLNCQAEIEFVNQVPNDITSFEQSVSNKLLDDFEKKQLEFNKNVFESELQAAIDQQFSTSLNTEVIEAPDGMPLQIYTNGVKARQAIVIVPPCGMPKELYLNWMEFLSEDFFVASWDSRALFIDTESVSDFSHSVDAQVDDLFAIIKHLKLSNVHLLGLCGGVVISLKAVAKNQEMFHSLSLWHGDLDFGGKSEKTMHQKNTQLLMKMGGESENSAEMMHKQLMSKTNVLAALPVHLAHLVIYPYTTPRMFYNYSRLNGEIMNEDLSEVVKRIEVPTLIVTSKEDETAHPDGSYYLNSCLINSTFIDEDKGVHTDVFSAPENLKERLMTFLK